MEEGGSKASARISNLGDVFVNSICELQSHSIVAFKCQTKEEHRATFFVYLARAVHVKILHASMVVS